MTVTCEAVNSARLSEDLRRTKMSFLFEMQLFEEKSLNRRTMLIQKKEEMGETMTSLTKMRSFFLLLEADFLQTMVKQRTLLQTLR